MHKKWSFEAYLAQDGQINLFALNSGDGMQLEALVRRWYADEQQQFFHAVEHLIADEDVWRNWEYVDADVLATHREWREMLASVDATGKDALQAYYDACRTGGDMFFCSYPEGGNLHWKNKNASPAHP